MALTPEDVINKRFQPTKFREGYDQDEVDDFLDEVVVELRRLTQENENLRKQVETLGGTPDESAATSESVTETTTTSAASGSGSHAGDTTTVTESATTANATQAAPAETAPVAEASEHRTTDTAAAETAGKRPGTK